MCAESTSLLLSFKAGQSMCRAFGIEFVEHGVRPVGTGVVAGSDYSRPSSTVLTWRPVSACWWRSAWSDGSAWRSTLASGSPMRCLGCGSVVRLGVAGALGFERAITGATALRECCTLGAGMWAGLVRLRCDARCRHGRGRPSGTSVSWMRCPKDMKMVPPPERQSVGRLGWVRLGH